MTHNQKLPLIILVATATDRKVETLHLRELPEEIRAIRKALQMAEQGGLCKVEERADATLSDVFDAFQKYRDRVAIFHFGGHANSYQLLLDSETAGSQGLAEFLGQQQGLQLVFLNGCSTYGHVEALHGGGISTVVATSRAIFDEVARGFAARFYGALGTGASVERAFKAAQAEASDRANNDVRNAKRDLGPAEASGRDISREGWPWDLKVASGAEAARRWNLADAAADPTFGIPPVPKGDLQEASEGPYLGLRRFERDHAELFFGRGSDIRALYDWLKADDWPVLLVHGQSGVGKSSLLDAGFLPRVEGTYVVRSVRRNAQRGLLWTLHTALGAGDEGDLAHVWRDLETASGQPVLVVLDQVEEALTQLIAALPTELEDFAAALGPIFRDRSQRPRGKLILGLRKDYYPEVDERLKAAKVPRKGQFLEPLGRAGIVEAIEGPTRAKRLQEHYNLTIAPPGAGEEALPEAIADDLRRDLQSPIAPTLQVLLAKMWERVRDQAERRFDQLLYREVAKPGEGGLLDAFLGEQLAALATWRSEVSQAGLVLDLLAYHTTDLGTSKARTWEQLSTAYEHHATALPEMVEQCKRLRLLSEEGERGTTGGRRVTRLTHDTLAPLVRRRNELSEAPGQRARRVLESRSRDWANGRTGTPLNETDLRTVEVGKQGMRTPTDAEQRLVMASRRFGRIRSCLLSHDDPVVRALVLPALDGFPAVEDRARIARLVLDLRISPMVLRGHLGTVNSATFSSDGTLVLTASWDTTARIWRADGMGDPVVLKGHKSCVERAAFSNDGTRVVTASLDGTARVWRTDATVDPVVLRVPDGFVHDAAFSPDGSLVVTCSDASDGAVLVWRADGAGKPVVLRHEGQIASVAFSPDSARVVTGSHDGTARVWRADGVGNPVVLRGHQAMVRSVGFSLDGEQVVTASFDQTARVWRANGAGESVVLRGHGGLVMSAAFSPDGLRVVTASDDQTARVWPVDGTGESVVLRGHEGEISSAAFSPDGTYVVTASRDRSARVWRADGTGEPVVLRGHQGWVVSVAFSPDGRQVVTASLDHDARIWRVHGATDPVMLRGHKEHTRLASFSPNGLLVVTASGDRTARVWRADGVGDPVVLHHEGQVLSAAFSPGGDRVVTASWEDRKMRVWRADGTGEPIIVSRPQDMVLDAAFSSDGDFVIAASAEDRTVRVWRTDGAGDPVVFRGHEGLVRRAAFSSDRLHIVTASDDHTARVWPADGAGESVVLRGHEGEVLWAAFSADGRYVVTASVDLTARVWRADGAAEPLVLRGHKGHVVSAAFSPEGARVVTASEDSTARVWRADSAGEPLVLCGHERPLCSAAFSPDGERVVTASWDGTARVWRVGWTSLLTHLQGATNACLRPSQRRELLGESAAEAQARYEECERRHGRTPLVDVSQT